MKFIAKTLFGLENILAHELEDLGAGKITIANRAVLFEGDTEMMYRVNYMSRTAMSVLMQIHEFRIWSAEDLYKNGLEIEWSKFMDVEDTFSIVPVVQSPFFNHTGYAALKLKDAVADYFRKLTGRRPSVDHADPRIVVNLHISNNHVTVSLDSTVVPLFKRGYRPQQVIAPINEVLAAGMLMISGWDAKTDLIDPMCGSGTIPIEAGLIACKIPPGKFRHFFGFRNWKSFDEGIFKKMKEEFDGKITHSGVKISGSDISPEAISQSRLNVDRAGLTDVISLKIIDFKDLKVDVNEGVIFINPPYGERIQPEETDALYSMMGSTMKHNFPGFTVWIISSNKESLKKIGLKPEVKHILYNGALECTFLKYTLYQGSKKTKKP
jgi:putative N6-adenine-specific DNA methylase